MTKPNPITEAMLSSLTAADIEDLRLSYAVCDPLEFARHLHTLEIPDAVKGELLRAKINQRPTEQAEVMQGCLDRAATQLWERLANKVEA